MKTKKEKKIKTFECEYHSKNFPKESNMRPDYVGATHHIDSNHANDDKKNLIKICQRCHDLEHGITPKINEIRMMYELYKDIQKNRIKFENNIRAHTRLEMETPEELNNLFKELELKEKSIVKRMKTWLKESKIYNEWLTNVVGVGPVTTAGLLALIGNINNFSTVSKLWSYCGYGLYDGEIQKRRSGQKINYNPRLKDLLHVIADGFLKNHNKDNCYYGKLYEKYRVKYDAQDLDNKMHTMLRAMRKVKKIFLKDLWLVWREVDGLPVGKPYSVERLDCKSYNIPYWK